MKINFNIVLVLLFLPFFGKTQNKKENNKVAKVTKHFISLKEYKKMYPVSTNYISINKYKINEFGDTLVELEDLEEINRRLNAFKNKTKTEFLRKDFTFLKYYQHIAFTTNKKEKNDSNRYHRYWKEPIQIFFGKSVPKKVKREFMKFARSLNRNIDSLTIEKVNSVQKSNYIIYYDGDYEYDERLRTSNNHVGYYLNWQNNKIIKTALKVYSNTLTNESLQISNLKRQFIKSLGYFSYKNKLPCKSAFSYCKTEYKEPSKFDLEILKYHYSYGFCMGSNLAFFKKLHEQSRKHNHKMYILQED